MGHASATRPKMFRAQRVVMGEGEMCTYISPSQLQDASSGLQNDPELIYDQFHHLMS